MTTTAAADVIAKRPELKAWADSISVLDQALEEAATARDHINRLAEEMDRIEAEAVLAAKGRNAEARKAGITLALADDTGYQELAVRSREARRTLAKSERCIFVLKERCRLLRSAVALACELNAS
jgi:hypothetical protein